MTVHLREGHGEQMSIYDAAMKYQQAGIPLIVLAGKEYGSGSSRDWAAKGTLPARRARGDCGELRADPPLESGRNGGPAAAVPRGRYRGVAGLTGQETYTIEGIEDADPIPRGEPWEAATRVPGDRADRHPRRAVLPPRRYPAVCAEVTTRAVAPGRWPCSCVYGS